MMGPEVAVAASVGSLALDAGSSILGGQGKKAEQDYLAARDQRAAELGRLRAAQTDVALREELNTTLGMIDVQRAAANIDPTSPTTAVLKEAETSQSDRQRTTKIAGINAQVDEDLASARYRKSAGDTALLGGYLGAGGKVLKGIGAGFK